MCVYIHVIFNKITHGRRTNDRVLNSMAYIIPAI